MTINMFDGKKVKEINFLDDSQKLEIIFDTEERFIVEPYSHCDSLYLKGKIKVFVERELHLL